MPTYNSASFLAETIESILSQTFDNFELIVVDDCSTDKSIELINTIKDSRIRYIQLKQNHGGPSKPRNIGISHASGQYIAMFDSDDIMLPNKLERTVGILDRFPEISVAFSDCFRFSDDGTVFPGTLLKMYSGLKDLLKEAVEDNVFILSSTDAYHNLFQENYIPTSSVMVRKEVFECVGDFDEELINGDDRDMWFRLSSIYSFGFINSPLHKYRVRKISVSNRGIITQQNRIRVMEKQLASGLPSSLEKLAKKLISKNYFSIGYAYKGQGDMHRARENYLKSNHYYFSLYATIGYLRTFLERGIIR